MEVLSKNPRIERMTFNKEGRPHEHDVYEYCYVLSGSGTVMGSDKVVVSENDLCKIPPNTLHWMIPEKKPFTLLIFYDVS